MPIEIGPLRERDFRARHGLIRQAFGSTHRYDPDAPQIPPDQAIAAYDDEQLVGAVMTFRFALYLHGGAIDCGGVSGVVVAPEARGQNVARRINTAALEALSARGTPIAALYPTTTRLYRSVGYEISGWWRQRSIAVVDLPAPDPSVTWERVPMTDPRFWAVARHATHHPDGDLRLDPTYEAWNSHWRDKDESTNRFQYIGVRDGADVAAISYTYASTTDPAAFYGLEVEHLAAVDQPAITAALGFLGANGTTASEVRLVLPEQTIAQSVPLANRARVVTDFPFMVRLVDLAGAMANRRVPRAVQGSVDLRVDDSVLAHNHGVGRLTFGEGTAGWEPGAGEGTVAVSVQDLAALYCGADPFSLRSAGRLAGATDDDCGLIAAGFVATVETTRFF